MAIVDNGEDAVRAVEQERFDLVLMHVQMPRMDGLEAPARIRHAERTTGKHVRIVAMTAHAMAGDREQCLAAGVDGYLPKPLRISELVESANGCESRDCIPSSLILVLAEVPYAAHYHSGPG